jgi:citrate lyase beta subunit
MSAKPDPIFLGVEASDWPHLGGYPVEIGWASAAGSSGFLIRPHETWTAWSAKAEAIHGITRETLQADGISCEDAVTRLEAAIGGQIVYSDAVAFDSEWLGTLYAIAGRAPTFTLDDANAVLEAAAKGAGVSIGEAARLAETIAPHRHRAQPDAEHAAAIWTLLHTPARLEAARRAAETAPRSTVRRILDHVAAVRGGQRPPGA